jgi:hypothetical protein
MGEDEEKSREGREEQRGERTHHEFLFNSSKTFETRSKFKMVICACLSDCGNDCNIVALWTNAVCA